MNRQLLALVRPLNSIEPPRPIDWLVTISGSTRHRGWTRNVRRPSIHQQHKNVTDERFRFRCPVAAAFWRRLGAELLFVCWFVRPQLCSCLKPVAQPSPSLIDDDTGPLVESVDLRKRRIGCWSLDNRRAVGGVEIEVPTRPPFLACFSPLRRFRVPTQPIRPLAPQAKHRVARLASQWRGQCIDGSIDGPPPRTTVSIDRTAHATNYPAQSKHLTAA